MLRHKLAGLYFLQYYLTGGGCKYGNSCRYSHSKETNELATLEYNFLGLPMRVVIPLRSIILIFFSDFQNFSNYLIYLFECYTTFVVLIYDGLVKKNNESDFVFQGEKECPYYMRTGSCGYGANCRFHHPDPTSVGGSEPNGNGESVGGFDSLGNHNGESTILNLSGASQPSMASWSSHMLSNKRVPYSDNRSSYVPAMHSVAQGIHPNLELNGYQVH